MFGDVHTHRLTAAVNQVHRGGTGLRKCHFTVQRQGAGGSINGQDTSAGQGPGIVVITDFNDVTGCVPQPLRAEITENVPRLTLLCQVRIKGHPRLCPPETIRDRLVAVLPDGIQRPLVHIRRPQTFSHAVARVSQHIPQAPGRVAMINPANGNTKPMFVGQGDQIFMNEVFLKYLTAPTITSGGNPPAFSLTPDGRLTAKNADISGNVNANSGTLNNVTINENCRVLGKLSANQIEGDLVKTVGKAFPRDSRAPERWPSGTITVRVYDDQPFDRQIVIPAVAFSGAKHEKEHTDIYSSCRLIVRKNGAEIYNRTALDNTLIYSGVIDMPAGHGHMTLEFSVSAWLVNNWYPTASISDLLVVVMKKATAGITIS